MEFSTVCGLEVHTELATKTKIFCSCSTEFGGEPNTHVCEICSGMPGTLPVLNKKVLEFAVRTGLATNCEITMYNKFDRKNYFYPDLPKAYQISQLYLPICRNGYIEIDDSINGGKKKVRIHEIHMEEDAGKLIHDEWNDCTMVNFNRCGVPLLEIVSEPDIASADEAVQYVEKLRDILQFCGVSDCKMQEGSLRADVNVSVMEKGSDKLGTRTEMKNINSFKAIHNAIESEARRQQEIIEDGGRVVQETRRWDDSKGESHAMRSKEDAQDYKYFPDPDLPPISLSEEYVENIRRNLPELPDAKKARYKNELGLSEYDTSMICSSVYFVRLFERTVEITNNPKDSANWIMGELMKMLNDTQTLPENMSFRQDSLGEIINLLSANKISRDSAKKVFKAVFEEDVIPADYIKAHDMEVVSDTGAIQAVVEEVIKNNQKAVEEYKGGKAQSFNFLIGQCMRALKGKAPAAEVTKLLKEILG
ncbi:MAG TPA: Asp-tRNA(Asn)/Glu-tRNA(Gln) amidotransferase subunit GatB [Candidatus Eubacterium faecipullorum]|uniref:Aspartyl/glutamyl-tRNA(Asn/Gln) amidotransferase subunit B n=1 Tax=Candidatus Eubacterium faecipullorum TaxID=2838571 RepID=A0A9D1UFL8_9FIRM|nr:Asp-tRNA(Asn)/Glu-tRNA(Gln) amidotransferase subunit GatB [Candidatus Eubacterium faecipullorum]